MNENLTRLLSFKLGIYLGKGLFQNYPENYNKMIPELAKELLSETQEITRKEIGELLSAMFSPTGKTYNWFEIITQLQQGKMPE